MRVEKQVKGGHMNDVMITQPLDDKLSQKKKNQKPILLILQ